MLLPPSDLPKVIYKFLFQAYIDSLAEDIQRALGQLETDNRNLAAFHEAKQFFGARSYSILTLEAAHADMDETQASPTHLLFKIIGSEPRDSYQYEDDSCFTLARMAVANPNINLNRPNKAGDTALLTLTQYAALSRPEKVGVFLVVTPAIQLLRATIIERSDANFDYENNQGITPRNIIEESLPALRAELEKHHPQKPNNVSRRNFTFSSSP